MRTLLEQRLFSTAQAQLIGLDISMRGGDILMSSFRDWVGDQRNLEDGDDAHDKMPPGSPKKILQGCNQL